MLNERMVNVSNRETEIRTRDCKALEGIQVSRNGHKDLKGHGLLQFMFQGCMNRIGITVSILDRFECSSVLDDRFLGLDTGLDMDHVLVTTQDRYLTL